MPEYAQLRLANPAAYSRWVESQKPEAFGLNLDQFSLSTRFPQDEEQFVDEALAELHASGLILHTDYPRADFAEFRARVEADWDHGSHITYIFPEEARLLFALGYILKGPNWLFGGSYYGFWAIWASPGVASHGGRLTLVDIDDDVMKLAERNFASVFPSVGARFSTADATDQLAAVRSVDVFVLDAEGSKDHPDPELRDKAIYAPIMRANSRTLKPGGLLIAHNMLLDDHSDCAYFAAKVAHNRKQYKEFDAHLARDYDRRVLATSSEGVGIYRRSDR
ncbi:class I SAM-dependent methyltransferase [Rathayibacter toxicus]|uniref:class I SAM-dependent methyltransferase n=1 Tax=Rathayibacter toxicus TaxID=145458 RepID=UPI000CE742EF|nr:class I SAM-dependent methyltransferase [Rathayibacter toxicus]PPI48899.1 hypothetical protein C5C66_09855 [Rathayibacter toxicus]QOD08593.1 class I SAM-dependent methyltransferase [Rathayibacter toxicus]QOD10698.1 class I SAM-dependent methyltransferase [Rathayibacter toxicus]QWL25393.1 hypothetical protein E2R32_01560 [Rathayibacter toxicus]QWL27438.1 hypothetical protein E2R33_01515 [Rathayibacter toxicus]